MAPIGGSFSRRLCATLGLGVAAVAAMVPIANTQWIVVDLYPSGAARSRTDGVSGGKQVGAAPVKGEVHAALCSGIATSWVDLTPPNSVFAEGYDIEGGRQMGRALLNADDEIDGTDVETFFARWEARNC